MAWNERRGDHVAGQPVKQVMPQARGRRMVQRGLRRRGGTRRVVGHQAGVARAARRRHHGDLVDIRVPGEHALDLPGLDAEAAHLELAVHAPGDLQAAVREPASQVSGLVHPSAWHAARVGQEPLRGEPRPPKVATGDTAAADVDFPRRARRHGVQFTVEHHDPRVAGRTANRHGRVRLRGGKPGADVEYGRRDGGLGKPVGVQQPRPRSRAQRGTAVGGVRHLPAGDHQPDRAQPLVGGVGEREHLVPVGRCQVKDGDLLALDAAQQFRWRHGAMRRQRERRARRQRREYLLKERVKGHGGDLTYPVLFADVVLARHLTDDAGHAAEADGDGLGVTGRARRVDDVAEVVRPRAGASPGRGSVREIRGELTERDQSRPGALPRGPLVRDHCQRAYLVADAGQALPGKGRVKRQVAAARLHDGEDGRDQVDASLQVNAGHRLRAHAGRGEVVREPAGRLVKLAIGHPRPAGHDGVRVGPPGCLVRETLMNEHAAVCARRRAGGQRCDVLP